MKSILDPSFKYTSSVNTDIAKTFSRIRRIQRENARNGGGGGAGEECFAVATTGADP